MTICNYLKGLQQRGVGDERFQSFDADNHDFLGLFERKDGKWFIHETPNLQSDGDDESEPAIDADVNLISCATSYWNRCNQTQQAVGFKFNCDHEENCPRFCQDPFRDFDTQLASVPWLEVRDSLKGHGRQVTVYLEESTPVTSWRQSVALRSAVLDYVTEATGCEFDEQTPTFLEAWHLIYAIDEGDKTFQVLKPATGTLPLSELSLDCLAPTLVTA